MKNERDMTKVANQICYQEMKNGFSHEDRIYQNFEAKIQNYQGDEKDIQDLNLAFYVLLSSRNIDDIFIFPVNHLLTCPDDMIYTDNLYSKGNRITNYLIDLRLVSSKVWQKELIKILSLFMPFNDASGFFPEKEAIRISRLSSLVNAVFNS